MSFCELCAPLCPRALVAKIRFQQTSQYKREDIRAHAIDNHLYLISTALEIQVCLTGFDLYLLRGVVDGYRDSRRDRQAVDHNFDQTGEARSRYGQLLSVNRSSR